ncbi:MAG TPA: undecaprenyl-phosphate glucose phosphotransferase [Oceanobacillus sp.]|nr:undecaprenyl-phosphate glucose phosphotransferase [Oceanobacillus sp.]
MVAQRDYDWSAGEGRTGASARNPAIRASLVAATRRTQKFNAVINAMQYVIDVAMLVLAFMLGYAARMVIPLFNIPDTQPDFTRYIPTMVLHVVTIVTLFYFARMYHQPRGVSRIDQARNVLGQVTIGATIVIGLQELILKGTQWDPVDYPRSTFFYVLVFSVLLVGLGREVFRAVRRILRQHGIDRENLLIVGVGKVARDITSKIKGSPQLGFNIVGIVSARSKNQKSSIHGIPIIGDDYQQIPYLLDAYGVHQVIIALPDAQRSELVDLVTMCRRGRVDIKIYPDMFAYMARDLSVDELGGVPLLTVRDIALRGWKLSLKRGLDIVGSVLGLIFLSPFMLLTAILIRLESPGPVFYSQERMGLDGRPFQMIKFRSMRPDAEAKGPGWTVKDDPRVTRIGRFMRRTSWDEIPQLINIFMGEMSLVGPRPERPIYVQMFRDRIPRYMERHREKAGMTGWAQVNGLRGDTSIEERTSYDLWYVENWSLWLDIKIIIRTIINVFLRRDENAY